MSGITRRGRICKRWIQRKPERNIVERKWRWIVDGLGKCQNGIEIAKRRNAMRLGGNGGRNKL